MDPLTITVTAGSLCRTVFNISWTLRRFIQDTKTVNHTVKDLVIEVADLSTALGAVKSGFEDPSVRSLAAQRGRDTSELTDLWNSVHGSLLNTRSTVDKLDHALDSVRTDKSGFARQAIRQLKLNLKDDEIKALRTQMRSHVHALEMGLTMINVRVTCSTPGLITAQLGPQISHLRELLEDLKKSVADVRAADRDQRPEIASTASASSEYNERLSKSAEKVLSSATTVYYNSERGSSMADSVLGIDEAKTRHIDDWIRKSPSLQYEDSASYSNTLATSSEGDRMASYETLPTEISQEEDLDSETAELFKFEVAERYFQRASQLFNEAEYERAAAIIKAGQVSAGNLTQENKEKLKLREKQLLLAKCAYRCRDLVVAEEQLKSLSAPGFGFSATTQATELCDASDLLARVYLNQEKLEPAYLECEKALVARRRLFGKEHECYYQSLWLLAEICELRLDHAEAEILKDMIPKETASTFTLARFHDLRLSQAPSAQTLVPADPKRGRSVSFEGLALLDHGNRASVFFGEKSDFLAANDAFPASQPAAQASVPARTLSSNNPFRNLSESAAVHRSQTQTSAPPFLIDVSRSKTAPTGNNPFIPESRSQSPLKSGASTPKRDYQASVDWSLLWRFTNRLPIKDLPEPLRGQGQAKYVTSVQLRSMGIRHLAQLVETFSRTHAPFISPLHAAAAINYIPLARLYVDEGVDRNAQCPYYTVDEGKAARFTPLHCATFFGKTGMIRYLIDEGVSPSSSLDGILQTPLHVASSLENVEVVQLLLEKRCGVDLRSKEGRTALHVASLHGRTEIAEILIEHGADIAAETARDESPLYFAAAKGFTETVELLLRRGAPINPTTNEDRFTPLHIAVVKGHTLVVKLLLEHGASLNALTRKKESALSLCITSGNVSIFRLLLGLGASISTEDGTTPLHLTARSCKKELSEILILRGAEVDATIDGGRTPLHISAMLGDKPSVLVLIKAGAEISKQDGTGRTAESIAWSCGHSEVHKYLRDLRKNAEIGGEGRKQKDSATHGRNNSASNSAENSPRHNRITAEQHLGITKEKISQAAKEPTPVYAPAPSARAAEYSDGLLVVSLETAGDQWNTPTEQYNETGWTPLHRAAYFGQLHSVKQIVASGVNVTKTDDEGRTPRDLARERGHVAVEAFLEGVETKSPLVGRMSRMFTRSKGKSRENLSAFLEDSGPRRAAER